jgi:transposase
LVEMTMTEQRYRAVLEVQAGVPVTEVAERFGVSRQAVYRWIGWWRGSKSCRISALSRWHRFGAPLEVACSFQSV